MTQINISPRYSGRFTPYNDLNFLFSRIYSVFVNTITEIQNATALSAKMLTQDKAQAYEVMGMVKAFGFIEKLLTVSHLKLLAHIRETKQYKELSYMDNTGKWLTVSRWEDFCNACGVSHKTVNENIANLNILGEDFLETSQRIGLGYRDLRKLRKLPEEERDLIINGETFKAKDKEELVEFIEEKVLAYAKEKETLEKQLTELKADASAKETIIVDKNKKIDDLSVKLDKKVNKIELDDDTEQRENLEAFQSTWGAALGKILSNTYYAWQLVEKANNPDRDLPRTMLQKMALDIGECRDKLNEILAELPSDTGVVDTSWLAEEK